MSMLRKELVASKATTPTAEGVTAYLLILRAVEGRPGLIHGHLHEGGASCAIGSYFDLHAGKLALPSAIVDEVAAVNDAAPHLSRRERKQHVLEWLRWKLGTLGWAPRPRRPRVSADEAATMATIARQVEDLAREPRRE